MITSFKFKNAISKLNIALVLIIFVGMFLPFIAGDIGEENEDPSLWKFFTDEDINGALDKLFGDIWGIVLYIIIIALIVCAIAAASYIFSNGLKYVVSMFVASFIINILIGKFSIITNGLKYMDYDEASMGLGGFLTLYGAKILVITSFSMLLYYIYPKYIIQDNIQLNDLNKPVNKFFNAINAVKNSQQNYCQSLQQNVQQGYQQPMQQNVQQGYQQPMQQNIQQDYQQSMQQNNFSEICYAKICSNCGTENMEGDKFCKRCGNPLQ